MPTGHRAYGLRFVIYVNDHPPAHVHVLGAGGEAKINLGVGEGLPSLLWAKGLDRATLRQAMLEVMARRDLLLAAWQRIHGPASEETTDEA